MAKSASTCRHPKAERIRIREVISGTAMETLVQWCGMCGALKTGDGPWWSPTLCVKKKAK